MASWARHADQPKFHDLRHRDLAAAWHPVSGRLRGATIGTGTRGEDAAQLYLIFMLMLGGAVVLWLGLNGLFLYFARVNRGHFARRLANRIIIGAGVLLPTVAAGALLAWGLSIMPSQRATGDGLVIRVTAEEWW